MLPRYVCRVRCVSNVWRSFNLNQSQALYPHPSAGYVPVTLKLRDGVRHAALPAPVPGRAVPFWLNGMGNGPVAARRPAPAGRCFRPVIRPYGGGCRLEAYAKAKASRYQKRRDHPRFTGMVPRRGLMLMSLFDALSWQACGLPDRIVVGSPKSIRQCLGFSCKIGPMLNEAYSAQSSRQGISQENASVNDKMRKMANQRI